jgi:hypothetical protein
MYDWTDVELDESCEFRGTVVRNHWRPIDMSEVSISEDGAFAGCARDPTGMALCYDDVYVRSGRIEGCSVSNTGFRECFDIRVE